MGRPYRGGKKGGSAHRAGQRLAHTRGPWRKADSRCCPAAELAHRERTEYNGTPGHDAPLGTWFLLAEEEA